MSLLKQIYIAVRFVGVMATLRTILYSLYRSRVEKQFSRESESGPAEITYTKKLEMVTTYRSGAHFVFNDNIRLEVTFMSPGTVRVTWQPGRLPADFAVENELTLAFQVKTREIGEIWQITAGELTVCVHIDGRVEYISKGNTLREDQPPTHLNPGWCHSAPLSPEAKIFGLGERSRFNLRPGHYRMWNTDVGGSYGPGEDPLYLTIPVYFCHQHSGSYMIFYENSHDGSIQFGEQAEATFTNGALRLFFIFGGLSETLEEYTRLTGRPPLPPRWALGYHQCRWGYKTEAEVREVVAGFKQRDLPLGVFHLDIDYMDGYRVFTVNKKNFPDLNKLAADLEVDGIKLVTILDPGVKIDSKYAVFQSGVEQDVFCKLPNGERVRGLVWPGWVHFPDFSRQITRSWWGDQYRQLVEDGVDGFWHDMNEPAAFAAFGEGTLPRATEHFFDGRGGNHEEAHNLYGAMMDRAGFEAVKRIAPEKRPWLLTRSGWAGVQRYAWKWTGDVESSWPALKMTIATVVGTGISGIPYSGSDIGGFSGSPDGELFARWFQMSSFMALFRTHAATGAPYREPWQFGEVVLSICREYLYIRQRLIPYFYSLTWDAHQTGAPLVRPVAWADESDPSLWEVDDAFLLGDSLLVAPVVEPGASQRRVILPQGRWYDFWNDTVYQGGREILVDAPLETIPVFVQEGTVVPMWEDERVVLHYYLQSEMGGQVRSLCYSDDGDGYSENRIDIFTTGREGSTASIEWTRTGSYPIGDNVRVVVHGGKVKLAQVDGLDYDLTVPYTDVPPFRNLRLELG